MAIDPASRLQPVPRGPALAERRSPVRAAAIVAIVLSTVGSACAGSDDPPLDADAGDSCTGEGDTFRVGMSKTSQTGSFIVELIDANPAPPGMGTNAWKIRIEDANGAVISGAAVNIALYMPKHRHAQTGTTGSDKGSGVYEITDLDLVMPGLFDVSVEVTRSGGSTDSAKFQFCISRKGD